MSLSPAVIWFLVGLVLAALEFAVPGIILIFFGVSAWIVALTTLFGLTPSQPVQIVLFALLSLALIFLLRRRMQGKFRGHTSSVQDPQFDLEEFNGRTVLVLKPIEPGSLDGSVEFKGASWRAVSDETLPAGASVRIIGRDGITLKVEATRR